jgi:hypothetical protein
MINLKNKRQQDGLLLYILKSCIDRFRKGFEIIKKEIKILLKYKNIKRNKLVKIG